MKGRQQRARLTPKTGFGCGQNTIFRNLISGLVGRGDDHNECNQAHKPRKAKGGEDDQLPHPNAEHHWLLLFWERKGPSTSYCNPPMSAEQKFWLVKTEPECFSIHDLAKAPNKTTSWSGVRNYQARNFMRDEMRLGDRVLVYHSSTDPTAIVGTATIAREAYPDHTAWDKNDDHFDAASTPNKPRWFMVDIRFEQAFKEPLPLERLRTIAALKSMELLRKGSRLSVQPVRKSEFEAILKLAGAK